MHWVMLCPFNFHISFRLFYFLFLSDTRHLFHTVFSLSLCRNRTNVRRYYSFLPLYTLSFFLFYNLAVAKDRMLLIMLTSWKWLLESPLLLISSCLLIYSSSFSHSLLVSYSPLSSPLASSTFFICSYFLSSRASSFGPWVKWTVTLKVTGRAQQIWEKRSLIKTHSSCCSLIPAHLHPLPLALRLGLFIRQSELSENCT